MRVSLLFQDSWGRVSVTIDEKVAPAAARAELGCLRRTGQLVRQPRWVGVRESSSWRTGAVHAEPSQRIALELEARTDAVGDCIDGDVAVTSRDLWP